MLISSFMCAVTSSCKPCQCGRVGRDRRNLVPRLKLIRVIGKSSQQYDKWAFNGAGVPALWKGRHVSSTSRAETLRSSPTCEFFIICHLNTKGLVGLWNICGRRTVQSRWTRPLLHASTCETTAADSDAEIISGFGFNCWFGTSCHTQTLVASNYLMKRQLCRIWTHVCQPTTKQNHQLHVKLSKTPQTTLVKHVAESSPVCVCGGLWEINRHHKDTTWWLS